VSTDGSESAKNLKVLEKVLGKSDVLDVQKVLTMCTIPSLPCPRINLSLFSLSEAVS
jgi:hypothetical protein